MYLSQSYEVRECPGKGLGCFATKKINIGTTILRETPLIKRTAEHFHRDWREVWTQFQALRKEDQIKYCSLMNKFSTLPETGTTFQHEQIDAMKFVTEKLNVDKEKAKKAMEVLQIYVTNSFPSGVGIKLSRFNHSCGPNAFVVKEGNGVTIKAMHFIAKGQEITLNYEYKMEKTEMRRNRLFMYWNFVCHCTLCSDEKSDQDMELLQEVHKKSEELNSNSIRSIENLMAKVECYKKYYHLMKKLKQDVYLILTDVIENGYQAAIQGALESQSQPKICKEFKMEAEKFAAVGKKIQNYIYGVTFPWSERCNVDEYITFLLLQK